MKKFAAIIVAGICLAAVSCHFLTPGGLSNLPEQLSQLAGTGQLTDSKTTVNARVVLPDASKQPDTQESAESETPSDDSTSDETDAADASATTEETTSPAGTTQYFGRSETSDDGEQQVAAWAAEATMNPDYTSPSTDQAAESENDTAAQEPAAEEEPAPTESSITQFYGRSDDSAEQAAWAVEATANPDYVPAETTTTESSASETETVEAGVTQFFGQSESTGATPAWAQEASPNPDYTAEEAIVVKAPKPKHEPEASTEAKAGVTQFFGRQEPADEKPAWAAEAKRNSNYSAAPPAAEPGPAQPTVSEKIATCRDKLNAKAQSGELLFRSGSSRLSRSSKNILDSLAAIAKECGNVAIEVGGHTDNTGSEAFNKRLSKARAQRVAKCLIDAGVKAKLLEAIGYGSSKPVAPNDTAEGRAKNRRIEFVVLQR